MLRIMTCAALFALPLFSTTSFAGGKRSYEECREQYRAGLLGLAQMRVRGTKDLRPRAAQRTQRVLSLAAWRAFRISANQAASVDGLLGFECLLLAQSRHYRRAERCPLLMLLTAPPPARECHRRGCC